MAVPWGLVVFLIGLFVGWLTPGRGDRWRMLKVGLFWGLVLAVALALIGAAVGSSPLGIGGMWAIFVSVVVLTLLFMLGTWVGDLFERATTRRRSGRAV